MLSPTVKLSSQWDFEKMILKDVSLYSYLDIFPPPQLWPHPTSEGHDLNKLEYTRPEVLPAKLKLFWQIGF